MAGDGVAVAFTSKGSKPFGAVLAKQGTILARGRNRVIQTGDPLAHAELECLRNAGVLPSYSDTTLYATAMPCIMCQGAIVRFGIPRVVVADAQSLPTDPSLMQSKGTQVVVLDLEDAVNLMRRSKTEKPEIWK